MDKRYNFEAESAYLGCLLMESNLIKDCTLEEEFFSPGKNRELYKCLLEMSEKEKEIDYVTIADYLGAGIEKVGGISYLTQLSGSVPSVESFKTYEDILFNMWRRNELLTIVEDTKEQASAGDIDEVRAELNDKLKGIEPRIKNKKTSIKDLLADYSETLGEDCGDIKGVPTGFSDLDYLTDGIHMTDLNIVAARPSMGKTAFCLNVGKNTALQGIPTGIISLEMSADRLIGRMISSCGNVESNKLKNASRRFDEQDWSKTTQAIGELGKLPIHIFDEAKKNKVSDVREAIKTMCGLYREDNEETPIVIIIDYLQLMRADRNHRDKLSEVTEISRELKLLAKEFNVNITCLSQLSRAVEQRQDKRPMLSDLRDSGSIEQDERIKEAA